MIEAIVTDNYAIGGWGISVAIRNKPGSDSMGPVFYATSWDERNHLVWETLEAQDMGVMRTAPVNMDEGVARAVYDALARYFGDSVGDSATQRKDFLHERGRVDKLIDVVTGLAQRPQDVHVYEADHATP